MPHLETQCVMSLMRPNCKHCQTAMVPVRIDWECKDPNCQPGVQVQLVHKGKGTGKTLMGYNQLVHKGKGYDQLVYKGKGWCISDVRWPTLTLTWLGLDSEGESDSCHKQSIHDLAVERLKEAKLGPEEDHEMGYNDDERWSVRAEADEAEGCASLAMGDTGGTYKGKVKGKGKSMAVDDDDKWERHKGKGNDGKGEEMIIRAPRKVQQPSWPCAWCNMEPHDAVWRPLDGATPFDTEERVCDKCYDIDHVRETLAKGYDHVRETIYWGKGIDMVVADAKGKGKGKGNDKLKKIFAPRGSVARAPRNANLTSTTSQASCFKGTSSADAARAELSDPSESQLFGSESEFDYSDGEDEPAGTKCGGCDKCNGKAQFAAQTSKGKGKLRAVDESDELEDESDELLELEAQERSAQACAERLRVRGAAELLARMGGPSRPLREAFEGMGMGKDFWALRVKGNNAGKNEAEWLPMARLWADVKGKPVETDGRKKGSQEWLRRTTERNPEDPRLVWINIISQRIENFWAAEDDEMGPRDNNEEPMAVD